MRSESPSMGTGRKKSDGLVNPQWLFSWCSSFLLLYCNSFGPLSSLKTDDFYDFAASTAKRFPYIFVSFVFLFLILFLYPIQSPAMAAAGTRPRLKSWALTGHSLRRRLSPDWAFISDSITSTSLFAVSPSFSKRIYFFFLFTKYKHSVSTANAVFNESDRIDYNERFGWKGPDDMVNAYDAALHKGLPYPILTVAEYLSLDEEGFGWGRTYRQAGYFSCITLW